MTFHSTENQFINNHSVSLVVEKLPEHVKARCCKCSRRARYRVSIPRNGFQGLLCRFHLKLVRALVYDLDEYNPWGE